MRHPEDQPFLHVNSEIGKLTAVLLHRPGKELEKLSPAHLQELLFDDIPWLRKMQEEHDEFAAALREKGARVYYVEDLLAQILEEDSVKKQFIAELLAGARIDNQELSAMICAYIEQKSPREIAEISVVGLNKRDLPAPKKYFSLADFVFQDYFFYLKPLPNLYFMRDPAVVIGTGISISSMKTETRRREALLLKYIYEFNPLFRKEQTPLWYDCSNYHSIEGGDILVLSKETIAIGWSERTSSYAIERIAKNLLAGRKELKEVLVVRIPEQRMFMHLDTVLTMVDRDKFVIYPGIIDKVSVYRLTRGPGNSLQITVADNLVKTLKKSLKLPAVQLIQTGGEDAVTAAREQWNDSTNTLAVGPGVVITYGRNEVSNEVLRQNGIEVVEIGGSELVRGRGGPRCMSMPLKREEL